jgi:3-hydroxyisobutyrate dehydrogenase-like beta-hydroxyacid dehydrogenase
LFRRIGNIEAIRLYFLRRNFFMSTLKVGFIGVGNMGMAMAKPLVKKGFPVTVRDLNSSAVEEIRALGASVAGSPREAAAACEVVIIMVRDIPQTDEVIFGKDGVWETVKQGDILIISNSIGPEYCENLYEKAKEKDIRVIDAAVSDPSGFLHTEEGGLTLMIGGDKEDVQRCMPLFEAMGKNIFHLGGIGMGQTYKLVNNLATFNIGTLNREILNLGLKAGLDLEKMIEVISVSTGGSWSMRFMGRLIKARRETPKGTPQSWPPVLPAEGPKGKPLQPLEKRLAMEMAKKLGAEIPIGRCIDELDVESIYDAYSARMKEMG